MSVTFWVPAGPPVIQDGVHGCYMLAVFKRVAHEEGGLLYSYKVSRACVASVYWRRIKWVVGMQSV